MRAAVVIALMLFAQPDLYTGRLHDRRTENAADPAVATAHRIEAELRSRVRFESDPATAAIRIVMLGKEHRVSIDAFRNNAASWTVERVELSAADSGYDRAIPVATRSELSPAETLALEELMRARDWGAAPCKSTDAVVLTVRFPEGVRDFAGCPSGSAARVLRILDGDASVGAH